MNEQPENNKDWKWALLLLRKRAWTYERIGMELQASEKSVRRWASNLRPAGAPPHATTPLPLYAQALVSLAQREQRQGEGPDLQVVRS